MQLRIGLKLLIVVNTFDLAAVFASEHMGGSSDEPITIEEPAEVKQEDTSIKESEQPLVKTEQENSESQLLEKDKQVKDPSQKIKNKKTKKKLSFTGGGQYTQFFTDLVDPSLSFNLSLAYYKNKRVQLGISQSISKLLVKNNDDDELVLQDTNLSYSYKPKPTFFNGGHANLRTSFKLPISEYSRINGIWTSIGLGSSLTWMHLNGELSNTLGAFGTIYANQYRTRHADFGGGALPYLSGNLSWSISYSGQKNFAYSLNASYGEIRYYNIDNESFLADSAFDHPYSVGLNMTYLGLEGLSIGGSYGQSNIFEQYGKIDYYIFDQENSNISFFASYSRSL